MADIPNGIYSLLELDHRILPTSITVLDEFIGDGYGIEPEASRQAVNLLAKTEGIILDPVYTAKAMAALLDWLQTGLLNESDTVLFWHTGGQLAWFYTPQNS